MTKILITGASRQLGTVLTERLQKHEVDKVIASDSHFNENFIGFFEKIDAMQIFQKYKITQIYHLAGILLIKGVKFLLCNSHINMKTFFNILEVSHLNKVDNEST